MKYSILIIFFLIITSCSKNKDIELIGQDIAGVDTRINRILVNKYAFEKAIVKIRGKVKELDTNTKDQSITFQLTDRKGNFINIYSNSTTDIEENDYLVLSGEYDSSENLLKLIDYEKFPNDN